MPCTRDEFVRQLWLSDFHFAEETKSAQLFRRSSDGAEVFVPKRHDVESHDVAGAIPPVARGGDSPCCHAESKLRGVFYGVTIMRCGTCHTLWQRAVMMPALRLVP